jgi:hypothetical protein
LEATATQAPAQDPTAVGIAQGLNPAGDPAKQVSIADAWKATVAKVGPVTYPDEEREARATEEPAAEEPEAPAAEKPEPKKAKAKEEPAEEPETEEEEEPARETVTTRDLIKERQKLRARFERNEVAQEQKWQAKHRELVGLEQRVNKAAQDYAPLIRAAQAAEAGDFDGIAKSLGEFLKNEDMKDWNTLNGEALKAMQSPVYKKLRDLERQQAEAARQRDAQLQQQQQSYAEQQRQVEIANWKRGIAAQLTEDEDVAIPAIIESRPQLVDAIFNIQQAHYDETGGDTLSARDAAVKLLENVRADFKFWSDFFEEHGESGVIKKLTGSQVAPKKKPAVTEGRQRTETSERRGAATRPAPKNVPQTQTAQAAALGNLSEKELKRITVLKMQEDFERLR